MKTKFFNTILFTLFTLGSIFAQKVNPLIVTVSSQQPTCYGQNNGSISLNPNGGLAPYTYLWSDGQTGSSITNLSSGNYSVLITDSYGQAFGGFFTLTQPQQINIQSVKNNVSAFGLSDGSIDVISVSNTIGNWTYNWSSDGGNFNPSTLDQSNLSVGNYKLTVTDDNGCQVTKSYQIRQNLVINPISFNTSSSISVYPNPSTGDVTIDTEATDYRVVNIITGEEVTSGKSNGEKIRINNLNTGTYMIYTNSGDKVVTERVTVL